MFNRNNGKKWRLVSLPLVLSVYVVRSSSVPTFTGEAAYDYLNVTSLFWWLPDESPSEHSHDRAEHAHHSSSLSLNENTHIAHSHFSDRFTTTHDGWPPQPKAKGDVTWLTDSSEWVSRETRQTADGYTIAQTSVEVRAALGARFTFLSTRVTHKGAS